MVLNKRFARFISRCLCLCLIIAVTAGIATAVPNLAQGDVVYSGVAAGDPTTNSAVLWTRAIDKIEPTKVRNLTLQIATDSAFSKIVKTVKGKTNANRDYIWKNEVTGLQSGRQYYYRFLSGIYQSPVGKFKTAPAKNQSVAVRFGFSGDTDGQWRPYPSIQNFANLNLDFFVYLGDIIYEAASTGSPATAATDNVNTTPSQLLTDYRRKYREQLELVNPNGFAGLKTLFASQANYTLLDNHELGNKQYINGGAPQGTLPGPGADATNPANDVNTTGAFINKTSGFKALLQAYSDYQPIRESTISAPTEPRTNGTQLLYLSQQWGANSIFINLDDRSYRDIRLKTAENADDTGTRANNPHRTMLGKTQLAWFKRTLLLAQANKITWKIIAISSPIDEIGNGQDGGKSWMGGYKAERNELLKFIADQKIKNVVFLTTDDHQNRINELTYFTDNNFTTRATVPNALTIVAGPIGAVGPDTITNHSFNYIKSLADTLATTQTNSGVNPLGLANNFPGLQNVYREDDSQANTLRQPVDFYSPDTFNYVTLDISADGKTLSVNTYGINSYPKNTFPEPTPNNPVKKILSFDIKAQ